MSHTIKGPGIAEKLGDHLIRLLVSGMNKQWPRYTWAVAEPELKPQPSKPFSPLIFYPGASLMGMWPLKSHRASHSEWPRSWFSALLFLSWNCFWTKGPVFSFYSGCYKLCSWFWLHPSPLKSCLTERKLPIPGNRIERRKIQEIREFKTK